MEERLIRRDWGMQKGKVGSCSNKVLYLGMGLVSCY